MEYIVVKCVSYCYMPSHIFIILATQTNMLTNISNNSGSGRRPPSTAIKLIFHCLEVESFRFFALSDILILAYPIYILGFKIHTEIPTCVILGLSMPHILRPPLFKIYYLLEHCYLISVY
ncbi:hypothetical protein MACK_003151 [Theileria orientalis]|uniref:Uncharacterized protein n=1 Tax=Theileria orientalis TaxID=68886 RepID=A0A976SID0_THEOR|nr:hypothetical protein MACK_003151 [Theileria orientalis]